MITTTSNTAFIEAQQYSQFILENLHDGLLPDNLYRNVSDFGEGDTLNIKTVGPTTLQEVQEDVPLTYNPIETGNVTLSITDYVGDAWYITDVMRQDGSQVDTLNALRAAEATRAIQERVETRSLAVLNSAQTAADANTINGFSHRWYASGSSTTMSEQDLIHMRLAFDKANVPQGGRVAVVDPVVAATFSNLALLTNNLDAVGEAYSLAKDGFEKEHQFVTMLHGWQIWTSNRLPSITSENLYDKDGANQTSTSGVANIFMSAESDQTKPLMLAWRQAPEVEPGRDMDNKRDKFNTTARWGVGAQRVDTLGVIVSSATATS